MSCTSSPTVEPTGAQIPDPIVDGESVVTIDEETEIVSMPLWYWKKIVRFMIDTLGDGVESLQ